MKHITRLITLLAFCAAPLVALRAAPLASETPVYASPDFAAPVLVTLGAGAEPEPATAASAVALPEGWQAIAITAATDIWVRDSDLNKELDVKPGSALRAEPGNDAATVGTMVAGDVTELRGIQGKWVQMHVVKKTTGYININAKTTAPADAPTPASTPASAAASASTPMPASTSTPAPAAMPASAPVPASEPATATVAPAPHAATQTAAPASQQPPAATQQTPPAPPPDPMGGGRTYEAKPVDPAAAAIPRIFEGTFASTRRAFMPRRPYDFQLTAPDGSRLAYLDLGKIVATEQFENYIGRTVVISGILAAVPNTQDAVIKAETLQAK
ncbi:MAG: SH3 domain-containing protein [Opitutaceae bacterium]|jgi:hypothetical protein|nr:SH3 domain-containing protein [Opitutaceae bacterium]